MPVPIVEIIAFLGAVEGAGKLAQVGTKIVDYLRGVGRRMKATEIRQFLERLGATGEHEIRKLVEGWDKEHKGRLDDREREALVAVLLNLTRRARFEATQGSGRSSILRSEALIEQLMSDIEPVRSKGEKVAPHHPWALEQFLGMGTFGEVWMARNPDFPGELRAYKFFTRPNSLQWVRKEQHGLNAVRAHLDSAGHPNIIRYLDVAITNQDVPYLAMEYAGGGSLEAWLLEDHGERPDLDKHEVIRGLVDGLAAVHGHGISHRDIKPANVVLTAGPRPVAKITDFGLGKVTAEVGAQASAQATQGVVVGTPMYLPPEAQDRLVERQPAQDDVFALGVVWYQLLVERLERPPYDFADELHRKGVDSHTIRLISRCLARPENRFEDARPLRDQIRTGVPEGWPVPAGLFDVQQLFREYHVRTPA